MKIAYIVPYVPNLIRTRPYNLIAQLSLLGNEVCVFTLGSNRQDFLDAVSLRTKASNMNYQRQSILQSLLNCVVALPSKQPLQTVYSWNPAFAKRIIDNQNALSGFDVIHVEHLRGSRYGRYIKSKAPNIPLVWDSVDCISYLFEQASSQSGSVFGKFITSFELPRTQKAEGDLVCLFDHVLATSEIDKTALLGLIPTGSKSAPISVLSNGVDLDYFQPRPDLQWEPETLIFTGKMSYHANISMVKYLIVDVMPKIWRKRPSVRLIVVGKDPPVDIQNLAEDPRITVTGTVDDIRPYLWKAVVAVVPLVYGAGIQNKILEAMACGVPVVTTAKALSSLRAEPGKEILVANNPDEFSSCVLQLIEDQGLHHAISDAGVAYVRKHHSWRFIASQLVAVYEQTIIHKRQKHI